MLKIAIPEGAIGAKSPTYPGVRVSLPEGTSLDAPMRLAREKPEGGLEYPKADGGAHIGGTSAPDGQPSVFIRAGVEAFGPGAVVIIDGQ